MYIQKDTHKKSEALFIFPSLRCHGLVDVHIRVAHNVSVGRFYDYGWDEKYGDEGVG